MQYNGMTPPFDLIPFEDMKKKQAELLLLESPADMQSVYF